MRETVDAMKKKNLEELEVGWKKMATKFQVAVGDLAVSGGYDLLFHFANVQNYLKEIWV